MRNLGLNHYCPVPARSFRAGIAAENPQRPKRKRKARGFAANSPAFSPITQSSILTTQAFGEKGPPNDLNYIGNFFILPLGKV